MIGKILGGRYELLEKIGGGGMATVYKARCHLLKRFVAVKVLRPEFVSDEEFVFRFKRESQAAASLSHPNIVNIYDVGQEEDIHYIVMEYVKGETLKDLIRREKHLSPDKATKIALQICSALEHAHKNHVIHRDVKPQNILVSEDGNIKVADFGIARAATSSTVTIAGTNVIGSVHYFSPEQARGGYTDEKSDLYSLGIVLYEMVTGIVPFEGESPISVAIKHIQEIIKPPREIDPNIPRSLQDIILKATEKDQERRYLNTREMGDDLLRSLREPNGDFVVRMIDSDAPTQTIPLIRDEDITATKKDKRAKRKDEKEAKYRILKLVLAVIVLLGLFVTLFLIGRSIYQNNFRVVEVPTPSVLRKTESEAKTILGEHGLQMKTIPRNDNAIPEGIIIDQSPKVGTPIKKGETVDVIVSIGPKKVKVPRVLQLNYAAAANLIESMNLSVGSVENVVSDKPENYVVQQDPKPEQEVLPGTEVNLWISKPPQEPVVQKIPAPEVVGLNLDQAKGLLKEYKLQVGEIISEESSQEKNKVLRQSPEADVEIDEGSKIKLWVSKGYKKVYIKEVTIPLENIEDNTEVKVTLMDQKGSERLVYNRVHNKGETEVKLSNLQDEGKKTLIVYINGIKVTEKAIDFNTSAEEDNL